MLKVIAVLVEDFPLSHKRTKNYPSCFAVLTPSAPPTCCLFIFNVHINYLCADNILFAPETMV